MVRHIAVLSDTHGVLPTLEAVLAEPDVIAADLVIVTGDLAAGPQPVQVLDRLGDLGDRVILVRGNADRDLITLADGGSVPDGTPDIDLWAAQQLRGDHVDLLRTLPHPVTVPLDGVGDVLFCHGTPRDDDEVVLVDTRPSRWSDVLAEVPDTVRIVVGGHTHMPFARLVGGRWFVNPGSTGMPYGSAGVPWVLLSQNGIQLRCTSTNSDEIARLVIADSTYPDVASWVDNYVLDPPSDFDALKAFGPRDDRTTTWDD